MARQGRSKPASRRKSGPSPRDHIKRGGEFELSTVEHFTALRSGLRRALLRIGINLGAFSVGDLSRETGRSRTTLYQHVRILVGAGLFEEIGERGEGRRRERVYRTASDRFFTSPDSLPEGASAALADAIAADLRTAERCVRRSLESGEATAGGERRDTWCGTGFAWLTPEQLRRLNLSADDLLKLCDGRPPRDRTRAYGVSVCVYPIDLERVIEDESGGGA